MYVLLIINLLLMNRNVYFLLHSTKMNLKVEFLLMKFKILLIRLKYGEYFESILKESFHLFSKVLITVDRLECLSTNLFVGFDNELIIEMLE